MQLTNSVYFCLFNDVSNEGLQVLDAIHERACYLLYTDVLLVSLPNKLIVNKF